MDIDIFISYKNDGEGRYFAEKLSNTLKEQGFSAYYNLDEQHAGNFPNRLREAIENCKDFLVILSQACLEQLIRHEKIDWVREEILIAQKNGKNIVPLLMPGVTMPKDKDVMPKELQFLPHEDAVNVSDPFDKSPLECLLGYCKSKPEAYRKYKNTYQSNKSIKVENMLSDLETSAQTGDFNAMFELATFYMYHIGETDVNKAFYWYNKVLDSTDEELKAHALNRIAGMYFSGSAPYEEQSFPKSFELREQAKQYSSSAAMNNAAMRKIGSGCVFNYQAIVDNYNALSMPDSVSIREQADFYLTYGKFSEAIELYKQIQNKMPFASYQLGILYKLGVHKDPPQPDCFKAEHFFTMAAEKGDVLSAYELGMLYYNPPMGEFSKDFERAIKYFKIAADAGNAEAQYKLGWMYRFGLGCDIDVENSIKYQEKAAKQGHVGAAGQLIYLYQIDGYINYQQAFRYAKQSADSGYAHGAYMCGNFLLWGRGCAVDESEALKYYKIAFSHGSYEAKIMLERLEKTEMFNR